MNQREKILAAAVLGMAALFAVAFGLRGFFLNPLREIDSDIAVAQERLDRIRAERRAYFEAEDRLKQIARRTFADDADEAAAAAGELLTQQIIRSNLRESDFTRTPTGVRRFRGAHEIGWNIQGEGPLSSLIDLLHALQQMPHLHRIENVSFNATDRPGVVRLGFRYLTLVLEAALDVARDETEMETAFAPDEEQRALYDAIVTRDLLRPYIKRPPEPVRRAQPATPRPRAPGPENFQIVSLTDWQGVSEVHVRDRAARKTVAYKVGDELAEGEVVMVDYRPLASPRNPLLLSHSRVILRIGDEFWAIERGQTFADKYRLPPEKLPEIFKSRLESFESEVSNE